MLPLLALACTTDSAESPAAQTTWHADVRPIVASRCESCHSSGGVAPFPLTTYEEVSAWGEPVVASVLSRTMPPWGQDPDCRPAVGSMWLSDEELAAFSGWQAAGYPEGNEADYIAPEPAESFDPGTPDLVLTAALPVEVDTSIDDDYRCMLIGEPLAEELMIRGSLTAPENLEVAHHALLYAIPAASIDALVALDEAEPGEGYTCFGDTGLDNAQTVAGWAPGNEADWLPDGAAIRVPAGSQLVLQMHYNSAALDAASGPQSDLTSVQLWLLDETPTHLVVSFPVAKTGIEIPAGDPASVQIQTQRIPAQAQIIGTSPHMHLRGTALSTRLIRSDGTEECIADVPNYDFSWQRGYGFAEEDWIDLSMDDQLEITCTYDNADNPDAVTWGDGSGDEMCLNYLALLMPYHGGEGVCAGYETCSEGCDDIYCRLSCLTAGGESCLYCGFDAIFSDCTVNACYDEIVSLYPCLTSCADGEDTGFLDCMYDGCGEEFIAYAACAQTADCEDDYAACDLTGL